MDKHGEETKQSRLTRYSGFLLECAIGLALVGLMLAHSSRRTQAAVLSYNSPVPATVCLTDDRTHDNLMFAFPAGTYTFNHCGTGMLSLSGTGMTRNTGLLLLTDVKPDRNISAGFNPGTGTGRATVTVRIAQGVFQTFTIVQNIPNAPCGSCP